MTSFREAEAIRLKIMDTRTTLGELLADLNNSEQLTARRSRQLTVFDDMLIELWGDVRRAYDAKDDLEREAERYHELREQLEDKMKEKHP
jgi:hypothetical protein